jgi:hypothetical protein
MTVFFTILAGVITFVLGQLALRLLVEPVQELKRTIADIAVAIIRYANVYSNPGVTGEERENEAAREIRGLASKLNAQMYLVPGYSKVHRLFGLPAKQDISQAMRHLIGISNSVHQANSDMGVANAQKSDKVCDLLGIHMPDEDRA